LEIGALRLSSSILIPVSALPVRRTATHCTTGEWPITVQARRVVPAAPVSEYAVGDFSERIFASPGPRSLLAYDRHARRALATAAELVEHRIDVAAQLRVQQRPLVVAFDVLHRQKARQRAADRQEQQHADDDQDDPFQKSSTAFADIALTA
jgi:hypothetical protein